jgi:flagellar FliL protein
MYFLNELNFLEDGMAKEEAPAEGGEAPAPKGKGKLLIIVAAVLAVLLIGGGVGAYFLLSKPNAEESAKPGEEDAHAEDEHPPVYEKLESFTVNLADQTYYLQIEEMTLLVDSQETQGKIKVRLPEVRDALFRLLSSKTAEELFDKAGKDNLAEEIRREINGILHIKGADKGVKKVLFPKNFILQES